MESKRLQFNITMITRGKEVRREGGSWERCNHVWFAYFVEHSVLKRP